MYPRDPGGLCLVRDISINPCHPGYAMFWMYPCPEIQVDWGWLRIFPNITTIKDTPRSGCMLVCKSWWIVFGYVYFRISLPSRINNNLVIVLYHTTDMFINKTI